MDFSLTDEQELLRSTVRKCIEASSPVSIGPKLEPLDWSAPSLDALVDLGIMDSMLLAEHGGLGFGSVETMIIGEEFGRAGILTPFVETSIFAAKASELLKSSAIGDELKGLVHRGGYCAVLGKPSWLGSPEIFLRGKEGKYVLEGSASVVAFAPQAEYFIVFATTETTAQTALIVLKKDEVDISPSFWTIDGLPAASVDIKVSPLSDDRLVEVKQDISVIDRCWAQAILFQGSELVGVMVALLNATLSHLNARQQFGSQLASFQALQHRVAEMAVAYELAQSLSVKLACVLDKAEWQELNRLTAAVKVKAASAARLIGHEAVQMHGAIGITEELSIGSHLKRIRALEVRLGQVADYQDAYLDMSAECGN